MTTCECLYGSRAVSYAMGGLWGWKSDSLRLQHPSSSLIQWFPSVITASHPLPFHSGKIGIFPRTFKRAMSTTKTAMLSCWLAKIKHCLLSGEKKTDLTCPLTFYSFNFKVAGRGRNWTGESAEWLAHWIVVQERKGQKWAAGKLVDGRRIHNTIQITLYKWKLHMIDTISSIYPSVYSIWPCKFWWPQCKTKAEQLTTQFKPTSTAALIQHINTLSHTVK